MRFCSAVHMIPIRTVCRQRVFPRDTQGPIAVMSWPVAQPESGMAGRTPIARD